MQVSWDELNLSKALHHFTLLAAKSTDSNDRSCKHFIALILPCITFVERSIDILIDKSIPL